MQLLSLGRTNKEIARSLKLTEKTVKHCLTKVFQKLQVRNRVEAVLIAGKTGNGADRALASVPGNVSIAWGFGAVLGFSQ